MSTDVLVREPNEVYLTKKKRFTLWPGILFVTKESYLVICDTLLLALTHLNFHCSTKRRQVLSGHGCNILSNEQHSDLASSRFYQRSAFDISQMHTDKITLENSVQEVAKRFGMDAGITWPPQKKKVCIFVSKYEHCFWELLLRHRSGELPCDIALVISNHPDLKYIADMFGIRFEVFKITKETKAAQEAKELELLDSMSIDLVVLARYMQIISDKFCSAFRHRVINIHHSFLPAFIGSKPYHKAFERGVKLIGATAHYATADLDEGPIIEQDVKVSATTLFDPQADKKLSARKFLRIIVLTAPLLESYRRRVVAVSRQRISHRDSVEDLLAKGRTIEREVLIKAVQKHLREEILVDGTKCIIFGD